MADEVQWIERRGAKRDRPMEVLALGVGRTGTDSIRVALKELGYDDCYHGYSCVHENPPDNYMWNEAIDAKFLGKGKPYGRAEWDQLLGHCRAVADLPCVAFYEELITAYPEAKVILTLPPSGYDRWYESTVTNLLAVRDDWKRDAWAFFNHEAWITRRTFWRAFDHFWTTDFRANAATVYEQHYKRIRLLVPRERLLEYFVSEGWEPLCEFLQKPVPLTDFPSGNASADFFCRLAAVANRRRRQVVMNGLITATASVSIALGVRMRVYGPIFDRLYAFTRRWKS